MPQVQCIKCQTETSFEGRLSFREECAKCLSDLHICMNCRHYDTGAHHDCRESSADWVKDKEKANICEYFEARSKNLVSDQKKDFLSAAEALFKKKS